MTDINALNAVTLYKKDLEKRIKEKEWPITDRDTGEALHEKVGHNQALQDVINIL